MGAEEKKGVLLKVENLNKNFGRKNILNSLNFEVNKGEIFGIIGTSGSGKTILLKTLINFHRPNSGKITFNETNQKSIEFRKFFGFSTQESCFYPELTTLENLHHFGKLYGIGGKLRKERIKELLNLLELEECINMPASQLSGGMQKRLDIACSMIHKPKLLLLDEPTVELDPLLRHSVMHLIEDINKKEGITIIIASHLLGGIETLCNNIVILHKGEILESGSLDKLRESYSGDEELLLRTDGDQKKVLQFLDKRKKMLGITRIVEHGNKCLTIYTKDAEKIAHYLLPVLRHLKEKIIELKLSKPSLTEIFTSVVSKKKRGADKK